MLAGDLQCQVNPISSAFWFDAVSIGVSGKRLSAYDVPMQGYVDRSVPRGISTAAARHDTVVHANADRWIDSEAGTPEAADHRSETSK